MNRNVLSSLIHPDKPHREWLVIGKRKQTFCIVSSDQDLVNMFQGLWTKEDVHWVVFSRGGGAVDYIFNEPPDLLVVDNNLADIRAVELVKMVKGENVYRQLPVVLCLDKEDLQNLDFGRLEVDDFLLRPIMEETARSRLALTLFRAIRELDANPLTKLPGNTSIIHRIQELMDRKEDFALAYVDLDNFKSYNDKYGFSRGDEILMMTARILVNTIRSFSGTLSFVGHVGGDDFVFILPPGKVEEGCRRIVENFDSIVPHFYDSKDRKQGKICSVDRAGRKCEFPLMTISIAVVFNLDGKLKHYGEASQLAMNLKKKAKSNPKSCYVLDKRKSS